MADPAAAAPSFGVISSRSRNPLEETNTPADDGLRIWSCVTCRRRKVRCDRRDPCVNCVKNNIECHFPVTGRLPRRRDPTTWQSPTQKQAELLGRLRRLEALVTELTAQVEDGPDVDQVQSGQAVSTGMTPALSAGASGSDTTTVQTPSSTSHAPFPGFMSAMALQLGSEPDEEFGRLVLDREGGMQIGKGFWSIFCNEVENIFQAIQDVTEIQAELEADAAATQTLGQSSPGNQSLGFFLGTAYSQGFSGLDDLHPLPSQMLFIWRAYVENVDPFIKVLHVPSVEKIITSLRGKFSSLGPNMEALFFAISLAAITSLDEDEAVACFGTPKAQLLARFRLGIERTLAQAELLTTKDITVLQAFVIYLSILPHIGSQELVSPLAGLLLRIATSLGLHRDGANTRHSPPLTPLDMEIRRRLWWQIVFIDSRTRDPRVPGLSVTETNFDTRIPANISDTDLGRDSLESNESVMKVTEATLCVLQCEIWRLYRFLHANSSKTLDAHLQIFHGAKARVEGTYFTSVSPDYTFESLVRSMVSHFFAKVEQAIYRQHFRGLKENTSIGKTRPTQQMLDHYLNVSISVLEGTHALTTEPAWQKWRWQLQGHFHWRSMGTVFMQLCQSPWTAVSERGWTLARKLFDGLPEESKENPMWPQLSQLVAVAEARRQEALTQTPLPLDGTGVQQPSQLSGDNSSTWTFIDSPQIGTHMMQPTTGISSIFPGVQPAAPEGVTEYSSLEELLGGGELGQGHDFTTDFVPTNWQSWDEMAAPDYDFWDPHQAL